MGKWHIENMRNLMDKIDQEYEENLAKKILKTRKDGIYIVIDRIDNYVRPMDD